MSNTHTALLEGFKIGNLEIKNRLVVAPMTRISAESNGVVGPLMQGYYESFAKGEFGLIITEGLYTDEIYSQGYRDQAAIATPEHSASWKPVVDAVHARGSKFIAQLMHAGALSQYNSYQDKIVGPSAIQPLGEQMPFYHGQGAYKVPEALTQQEIETIVTNFAQAALHAKAAGFDGVEIHGANGYLLDQFLTVYTNGRQDEYGGSLENRLKIYQQVIEAVRETVGKEFIVGVRFSQKKINDTEYTWPEKEDAARVIFSAMRRCGADYIHTTEPVLDAPAFEGVGASLAQLAKQYSSLPVIANGGIVSANHAATVLSHQHADMIALGKTALANPNWPELVRDGKTLQDFDFAMLSPIADLENAQKYHVSM